MLGHRFKLDEVVSFTFDHHERTLSDLSTAGLLAEFIDRAFRSRRQRVSPDVRSFEQPHRAKRRAFFDVHDDRVVVNRFPRTLVLANETGSPVGIAFAQGVVKGPGDVFRGQLSPTVVELHPVADIEGDRSRVFGHLPTIGDTDRRVESTALRYRCWVGVDDGVCYTEVVASVVIVRRTCEPTGTDIR